ncbi:cadmium resistance transporter [Sphaerisporangium sp. NBC_01403]|uniref:cadmium resistance transporter n=1 Tax=Sphaerisporangium sp. NBC_01403 TaxID=2903599 RepID=UPI0032535622
MFGFAQWSSCSLDSATMDQVMGTIAAAAGMWAGTNVDDIIVLTVLFLSFRAGGTPKAWQIWAGQYAGIAVLVAVSVIAALGLTIIPDDWVGLLGLVPFALGVRGLIKAIRARNDGEQASVAVASGLLSVAGVTIANGADNISVYTPVFRTIGTGSTVVTIAVFFVAVAVWCLAGSLLSSHKKIIDVVERYGHWIVPVVFMLIGGLIVAESGVLARIF